MVSLLIALLISTHEPPNRPWTVPIVTFSGTRLADLVQAKGLTDLV